MTATRTCGRLLLAFTALSAGALSHQAAAQDTQAAPDSLEKRFRDPPAEARPRVWWHWLNGNVTEDGIRKDLAWMKRVGIAGAQTFDAAMQTPQIVDRRLAIFSPEWNAAMRVAASEARRLGLELAIASSPGWTETGGPWVPPADGMKKLVWSDVELAGDKPFRGELPRPPGLTGPYQSIPADPSGGLTLTGSGQPLPIAEPFYRDVAVLAYPVVATGRVAPAQPSFRDGAGAVVDSAAMTDADLVTSTELARPREGVQRLVVSYDRAVTVRSARLLLAGAAGRYTGSSLLPVLEASDDGKQWRRVADIPVGTVPTTRSFPAVNARKFRLSFNKAPATGAAGFMPTTPGLDMGALGRMLGGAGAAMMANPGVRIADFRLSEDPRVDRGEAKAGFEVVDDYGDINPVAPDDVGIPVGKVINLTARLGADGKLDWTPPAGSWRVVRIGWSLTGVVNHPASPEVTGLEVDKYDGEAVARYMAQYLGRYRKAVGTDTFGTTGLSAFLNDSIESGAANWTPKILERFKGLRGYDPSPWLPVLTGVVIGSRAESDKFLSDWRQTLSDLIASEHYGTIARVARENGLTTYAEALENRRPSFGDDMAMRSHADVPMAALWTFTRERGPAANYLVDIKGAASIANLMGKPYVAAEMMTSLLAPWAFGPRDLKRVADLAFVLGVNRPIIHTSVHSPSETKQPGLSLFIFGQYFNRHESWAELAKPWVDYLSRNALLLQQGRRVTDLAYYYGEDTPLTGLYSSRPVSDAPAQHGYDFVDAQSLQERLDVENGQLVSSGGARYQALYLGGASSRMSLPVLRRIAALARAGATIIGKRPEGDPGLGGDPQEYRRLLDMLWPGGANTDVGKGRVIVSDRPEGTLVALGIAPDFRVQGGAADTEILFNHRRSEAWDSYFVVNRRNRTETVEARFRIAGRVPRLWHAESGTSEPVSYRIEGGDTIVPLTLAPEGSVHVVFTAPAVQSSAVVVPRSLRPVASVTGPWSVTFEEGRGAPPSAVLPELKPLDEHAEAGIRYYSGIATYDHAFRAPSGWRPGQPLWLDLGEAAEIAEVTVNGMVVGGLWNVPWQLDIGAQVRRGENRLRVRVANLWVNRFVGDAQPGATKVTWTASPTYGAKAPLRRSGLIGPVRLLVGN